MKTDYKAAAYEKLLGIECIVGQVSKQEPAENIGLTLHIFDHWLRGHINSLIIDLNIVE